MRPVHRTARRNTEEILKVPVLVYLDSETKLWAVECPTLRGCYSGGRSRSEALENVREAVRLYLETLRENLKGSQLETVEIAG